MNTKKTVTALIISVLLVLTGCNQPGSISTSGKSSSSEIEPQSADTPEPVPSNHIHTKRLGDALYVYTYIGEDLDKGYGFGIAETIFTDGKENTDSLTNEYADVSGSWNMAAEKKPLFFIIRVDNIKFDGEETETPKIVITPCYGWVKDAGHDALAKENDYAQQFLPEEYPQYTKVTFVEQDEQEYHLGDPILIGFVTEPDVDVAPDSTTIDNGLGLYCTVSNFTGRP